MDYLLDTNILIRSLLNELRPDRRSDIGISVITEAEILRLPGLGEAEIDQIRQLLWSFARIPVDSGIAQHAGELGRTRKIKLPDLLIAATALELGAVLVTHNARDFRGIPGLKVQTTWTK